MKRLTFIFILTACAASGCAHFRGVEAGKSTGMPGTDPKADVIAASRKLIALNALTGRIEATGETRFSQFVKYAGPDKYEVSYRDEGGAELDMIMADNKSYVRSGDTWSEMHSDTNPTPTMRNSFTDEVLDSASDVTFEGEDTVDGAPAFVYSYKLVTKVGSFPVTQKIWVDKSSGIPIKCYVEYTEGPIKTLTTTFDTESPVTIDLPNN